MAYLKQSWHCGPLDDEVIDYHCTGFHNPAQYFALSNSRDDFYRYNINSFVAVSRISLQRGKEKAMCIIHVRVQCSDRFSEVLVGDTEHTELTIESIVGTALLEVFDTVLVDDVTVYDSPERNVEDREHR